MILNARADCFRFSLPKGFIPQTISDKYYDYIKRVDLPFDSIVDVVNLSIVKFNFPGMTFEVEVQTIAGKDKEKRGRKITYRSAISKEDILDTKTISIKFNLLDGFVNYWVLLETFMYYYDYAHKDHYTIDLPLVFLDSDGIITGQALFKDCIIKNISELDLDFSSPNTEIKNFTMDLEFIELKIDFSFLTQNQKQTVY